MPRPFRNGRARLEAVHPDGLEREVEHQIRALAEHAQSPQNAEANRVKPHFAVPEVGVDLAAIWKIPMAVSQPRDRHREARAVALALR